MTLLLPYEVIFLFPTFLSDLTIGILSLLNNQCDAPISILPDEILTIVFSYLSPRDLLNAKLVAKLWQSISNEPAIWRNLINQYFPYLLQQNQNTPQVGPKALFIEEFQHINDVSKKHPEYTSIKAYLFASLSGDIEKIEKSEINDDAKERLYVYAAANGHIRGLMKLNFQERGYALMVAAMNGFLPACQMILTQAGQEISATHKGGALQYAAKNGYLDVVQALLTQAGQQISNEVKGWALQLAASKGNLEVIQILSIQLGHKGGAMRQTAAPNGHLNVVQYLLRQASGQISAAHKGQALRDCARNGHLEMIQALLTQAGQEISVHYKGCALWWAAQKGHLNVVKALLTQASQQISAEDKCSALEFAAQNDHLEVVQVLLTQIGHEISAEIKGVALRQAASKGYLNMVQAFLTLVNHEISAAHKGEALVLAAQNDHLEVVQVLLIQAGQEISDKDKCLALWVAAKYGNQSIVSFLLETYGHELSPLAIISRTGFVRACKFYTSRMATAFENLWDSFAPSAPVEQPTLPPVTIPLLEQQSVLPPTTQEIPRLIVKRKQELSSESTNNEMDAVNDESHEIKRVKLR